MQAPARLSYLDLINDFWRMRREVPFSSVEADMYFYLLEVCNSLGWKNPFSQANPLIAATLGVSEKTLIAARNRLKQAGLIDFQSGHKRAPTVYKLLRLFPNRQENLQAKGKPIREQCDSLSGSNGAETLQPSLDKEEEKKREDASSTPAAAVAPPVEVPAELQPPPPAPEQPAAEKNTTPPVAPPPRRRATIGTATTKYLPGRPG